MQNGKIPAPFFKQYNKEMIHSLSVSGQTSVTETS